MPAPPQICDRPALTTKRRYQESAYNALTESLKRQNAPLVYCRVPLEQDDLFSCGYRMIFHAECIERALVRTLLHRNTLEDHLESFLKNETRLRDLTLDLQYYIEKTDKNYDFKIGTTYSNLIGFIQNYLPLLKDRIMLLKLQRDNEIVTQVAETKLEEPFETSAKLENHLNRLRVPLEAVHFACFLPSQMNHWILGSIVTDETLHAKLYVMDSNNNSIEKLPAMATVIQKLLEYVQKLNARNTAWYYYLK